MIIRRSIVYGLGFFLMGVASSADEPKNREYEKGPISKTQFFKNQKTMLNRADTDLDGRVTREERNAVRLEEKRDKYREIFRKQDPDSSGFLTLGEYEQLHKQLAKNRIANLERDRADVLYRYDLDENGAISAEEFDSVIENDARQIRANISRDAQRYFKQYDEDSSGDVTFDEYVDEIIALNHPFSDSGINDRLLKRDLNRDGTITRTENNTLAAQLFDFLDKNKDSSLSIEEQGHIAYKKFEKFEMGSVFIIPEE